MKFKLFSNKGRPCQNRAFSLIELMIVVAIIGILTTIALASFSSAKAKSRDGKRVSDLGNIQVALAYYFDRCRQYPASQTAGKADWNLGTTCPNITSQRVTLGDYIGIIPTDPQTGAYYEYGVNSAQDAFLLRTTLEQGSSILTDSFNNTYANDLIHYHFNNSDPLLRVNTSLECYDSGFPKVLIYCLSSKL